jgi:hypothetical protein
MQLRTEIEIEAPCARVWEVLTDFQRFHEWNPFITSIAGELRVGQKLEVTISPPESSEMTFKPHLLVHEPNQELRWRGKVLFKGVFDGEHFFQLSESAPGRTRFVHGEDFSGFLVRFMTAKLTHVARGFIYMNQALKKRVEGPRA